MLQILARGTHVFFTLLFLLMAVIQLNDPDPIYWVTVYVFAAAIPAGRLFGYQLTTTLKITGGMVLAGMLISFPGFIDYLASGDYASISGKMMAEKAYVELAREFIGLLIAAVCLAGYTKPSVNRASLKIDVYGKS